MADPLTGGCQCGSVRWRVEDAPTGVELCHCSMCRRAVGNIHMASVSVPKAAVAWTGTPASYASSPIATRGFCATCGTPISFAYNDSARMDLMAGTADDADRLHPERHFGVESRLEAFRHLDGLPGTRTEDEPGIARLWEAAGGRPERT